MSDVSLAIESGEMHALVGQNGAGKSTLVNILSGMLTPDAGEIFVDGRLAPITNPRQAIELGIATVYQELSLLPNLTVAQNIALGREPRRLGLIDARASKVNARQALDRVGLTVDPDRVTSTLTLADRQLVEIARALSHRPSILVLDEPTASLARREADRFFEILADLRAQGMAILFVSHRFREILDHCDRVTILRNGYKVRTAGLDGLTEASLTEAMIGGKTLQYTRSATRHTGEKLVEITNVSYRDRIRQVSLTAHAGEIVALTGLLGAGQNEIARILGGDLQPSGGMLWVCEQTKRFRAPRDAVAAGICLLSDDRKYDGILPNLPLRENLAFASLDKRRIGPFIDFSAEAEAVANRIARFGIVARSAVQSMRTLSGGNQQKTLIARWHLADCPVFVLIEPTRGVDVGSRADIYQRLGELAEEGKAIIVVSSDPQEVLAIADRILVVRDGRIAAEVFPKNTDEESLNLLIQGVA